MPSCHSTNDIAMEMVRKSDTREGTVIITDEQVKGRGQRGNEWLTTPGKNITLSLILKPNFIKATNQYFLNMAISIAVNNTIKYYLDKLKCEIKWPNDILVNRKKIAGILIENNLTGRNLEYSIVGIGLNVNQLDFNGLKGTSLKQELEVDFSLREVLQKLIENIEAYYLKLKASKNSEIKEEYLESLLGYKTRLRFRSEYEFDGLIEDVSDTGILSVFINGSVKTFDFKEIEFLL